MIWGKAGFLLHYHFSNLQSAMAVGWVKRSENKSSIEKEGWQNLSNGQHSFIISRDVMLNKPQNNFSSLLSAQAF